MREETQKEYYKRYWEISDTERPKIDVTFKPCIELELLDCNCTNCKHMVRDLANFDVWKEWNRWLQMISFGETKAKLIDDALNHPEEKSRISLLRIANNYHFEFDKSCLISYGDCSKFNKPVSFIPGNCQLETQECFEHRRL